MHNSTPGEQAVILTILGAWCTLSGTQNILRGWGTGNWKPAQGEITEAFVSEVDNIDQRSSAPRSLYRARILYTYTVYGKQYEGDTLRRGLFRMTIPYFAQREIEEYHVGRRLTVYYKPSDPSQAVIVRGAPLSAFIQFGAGLVFLFIAFRIL